MEKVVVAKVMEELVQD
jgi:hypothetical protein